MTTKEYIQKEANSFYDEKQYMKPLLVNGFKDGLSKGLEIAKEFAEWVNKRCTVSIGETHKLASDGCIYTTTELLEIFLT